MSDKGDKADRADKADQGGRKKAAAAIFERLQAEILEDRYAAGERLAPERELAREHGANRNTVREAIRRLEQARLVTVRQGAGVAVTDFRQTGMPDILGPFLVHGADLEERVQALLDLLEARAAVLELTVGLAARRADARDVERMRELADAQARRTRAGDRVAIARGDLAWLDALLDAAHSLPVRWIANAFIDIYRGVLDRFPSLWVIDPAYGAWLYEVVEAVADRRADDARALLRDYFARTDETLVALLRGLLPSVAVTAGARPAAED